MNEIDGDKLNGLVGKMLGDLGGAFSVPTASMACVPLMSDTASFASSTSGLICARFNASALAMRAPLSSKHSPSPISASAR